MKPEGEHNFFRPKPLVVSPLNCHSADKIASNAGYIYDVYDKAFFEEIQRITVSSYTFKFIHAI